MKLLNKNKSGQATLILVMITMVAVLGVAATSATQSSLNLKNTVYGVQSEQALSCAEAGAEKMLGKYTDNDSVIYGALGDIDEDGTNDPGTDFLTETFNASGDSGCSYRAVITNYPRSDGKFSIKRLLENSVQQLKISGSISPIIEKIQPLNSTNGQLAVYVYSGTSVTRRFYHCGNGSAPTSNFITLSYNNATGTCSNLNLGALPPGSYLRIRALNNDFKLDFAGFVSGGNPVPVGYYIKSVGTSGTVRRTAYVYRFYRQLPSFFDEAVVIF